MKEERNCTVNAHISSLILEIEGFNELIEYSNNDARILTVICTLESLKSDTLSHDTYKSEIFKCINLIQQISRGDNVG